MGIGDRRDGLASRFAAKIRGASGLTKEDLAHSANPLLLFLVHPLIGAKFDEDNHSQNNDQKSSHDHRNVSNGQGGIAFGTRHGWELMEEWIQGILIQRCEKLIPNQQ